MSRNKTQKSFQKYHVPPCEIPMTSLNQEYWKNRYAAGNTQWDIGRASEQLLELASEHARNHSRILIPGAGRAYEYLALRDLGYKSVSLCDWAEEAFFDLVKEFPAAKEDIIVSDFFQLEDTYDLILEMTFFCALHPSLRSDYVNQCYNLLGSGGCVAGLLFNREFDSPGPPFGGSSEEYLRLFGPKFDILRWETSELSIPQRRGKELVFVCQKAKSNE